MLCLAFNSMAWANDPDKFMAEFEQFVTGVEKIQDDSLRNDTLTFVKGKYVDFLAAYSKEYKTKMSNSQLEDFAKYRARFKKKTLRAAGKRSMAKVSGWLEGIVGD